ncbi:four helix bundle protein [Pedobacter agri]|nr:four helix bundle protein [Pedobacter agri]
MLSTFRYIQYKSIILDYNLITDYNMENKLEVWKKAHDLTLSIYLVTKQFPKEELFGLTAQIRRSASTVPTNIVEGQAREYTKEFIQFLFIAKGSLIGIKMMLNKLIKSLR